MPTPPVLTSARLGSLARALLVVPACASLLWLTWGGQQSPPQPLDTPFDPDAHCWRHRLLLLFAAAPDDPLALAQQEAFVAQRAALDERDVLVATLFDDAVGAGDGQPIAATQTAALRARYRVAPRTFAVLLLGKDGGVKLHAERPVAVDAIAALIDTMPMRQTELRQPPSE